MVTGGLLVAASSGIYPVLWWGPCVQGYCIWYGWHRQEPSRLSGEGRKPEIFAVYAAFPYSKAAWIPAFAAMTDGPIALPLRFWQGLFILR